MLLHCSGEEWILCVQKGGTPGAGRETEELTAGDEERSNYPVSLQQPSWETPPLSAGKLEAPGTESSSSQ